MARPGLMKHRKFLRLAAAVGGSALARGHLELIWDSAYECGDAYLGDATDVEMVACWDGPPGELVAALLTCGGDGAGFIEQVPDRPGRYQVHDLFHHAPDYVRKRWTREAERRSHRDTLASVTGQRPVSDRSVTVHGADNGRTPAPAPAPREEETPLPPKDVCPETAEPVSGPPPEAALLSYRCDGQTPTWDLTPSYVAELGQAFPSLDILAECRRALVWISADASRRKTARGMKRFLVGWLGRAQNNGGARGRAAPPLVKTNNTAANQNYDREAVARLGRD